MHIRLLVFSVIYVFDLYDAINLFQIVLFLYGHNNFHDNIIFGNHIAIELFLMLFFLLKLIR